MTKVPEIEPGTALEPTDRGLIIPPSKKLLFTVASLAVRFADPRATLSLLLQNPEALDETRSLVFAHPFLVDADTKRGSVTLGTIRTNFPETITYFSTSEVLTEALGKYPQIQKALAQERKQLSEIPNSPQVEDVKDIELTLKMLLETGSTSVATAENYYVTLNLISFAEGLRGELDKAGISFTKAEEESLRKMSLGLNLRRRLIELNPKTGDKHFGTTKQLTHPDRLTGYQANLAVIIVHQRLLSACSQSGVNTAETKAFIESMKEYLADIKEQVWREFPEYRGDLMKRDIYHGVPVDRHWIEEPGKPDFDQAERTSFLHGGN